jgi:hypothetical protein
MHKDQITLDQVAQRRCNLSVEFAPRELDHDPVDRPQLVDTLVASCTLCSRIASPAAGKAPRGNFYVPPEEMSPRLGRNVPADTWPGAFYISGSGHARVLEPRGYWLSHRMATGSKAAEGTSEKWTDTRRTIGSRRCYRPVCATTRPESTA